MADSNIADRTGENCGVCGEPLDDENSSTCRFCGKGFHMVWDTSKETTVPTCGRVQVDTLSLGLVFICSRCDQERRAS